MYYMTLIAEASSALLTINKTDISVMLFYLLKCFET